MMLKCDVPEFFEHEIRLHNLNDFIRTISLFEEPDYNFREHDVIISDSTGASMKYAYADREDLLFETRTPPPVEMVSNFNIQYSNFNRVIRAAQMHKVEDIGFFCGYIDPDNDDTDLDPNKVYIKAHNKKRVSEEYKLEVIGATSEMPFTIYLKHGRKCAKLLLMALDYNVRIGTLAGNPAIQFKYITDGFDIEYTMAGEYGSVVGYDEDIPF